MTETLSGIRGRDFLQQANPTPTRKQLAGLAATAKKLLEEAPVPTSKNPDRNRAVVRDWRNLQALQKRLQNTRKRLKALTDLERELDNRVTRARAVTEVYERVPLSISDDRYMSCAAPGNVRRADWYLNQHNRSTWGLNISGEGYGYENCGFNWPSKRVAMEAARRWIVTGRKPEWKGRKGMGDGDVDASMKRG